jgi:GNAT superfamily N-acetyltransferase
MQRLSMPASPDGPGIDPEIVARWAAGWAVSRGVQPPVPVHDGVYLEVGLPEQQARYVFPALRADVIRSLVNEIDEPWVYLKLCAAHATAAPLFPEPWRVEDAGFLMAAEIGPGTGPVAVPAGYTLSLQLQRGVAMAAVTTEAGEPAAQGRLVVREDTAVFDQIETREPHRRRGLGGFVMNALAHEAVAHGARRGLLAATHVGHALYTSLGWRVLSPYTSAFIPG